MFKNLFKIITAVGIALFSCGCQNSSYDYTVNPDGSGKVTIKQELSAQMVNMQFNMNGETPTPKDNIKRHLDQLIDNSKGISIWKGMQAKLLEDGRGEITVTGYFKNIRRVNFNGFNMANMLWTVDKDGAISLKMTENNMRRFQPTAKPAKLTEEQIKQKVKLEKLQLQNMVNMMELNQQQQKLRFFISVKLPGKIEKMSGFQKTADNAASLEFTFDTYKKFVAKVTADDKLLEKYVREGKSLRTHGNEEFNKFITGGSGSLSLNSAASSKPLFDYKEESKAALVEFNKWQASRGKPQLKAAGSEMTFKRIALIGMQKAFYSDNRRHIFPFYGGSGITLSFLGELPNSITKLKHNGKIISAIDENGKSLLEKDQWRRNLNPRMAHNNQSLMLFSVSLNKDSLNCNKIKRLEGEIEYFGKAEIKQEATEELELKQGASSKLFNTQITSITLPTEEQKEWDIEFKIHKDRGFFKEIKILDQDGMQLEGYERNSSSDGKSYTTKRHMRCDVPQKVKVEFSYYTNMTEGILSFAIEDIPLNQNSIPEDQWPVNKDGKGLKQATPIALEEQPIF